MDTFIFVVGVCEFLLVVGGLIFTVIEFKGLKTGGRRTHAEERFPL